MDDESNYKEGKETDAETDTETETGYISDNEGSEDFLADLGNDQFVPEPYVDKEEVKNKKQQEKEMKQMMVQAERQRKFEEKEEKKRYNEQMREEKKNSKKIIQNKNSKNNSENKVDDDDIYSALGTPILGKERLILLKKVSQYKSLFPNELKGFKIKKNPSVDELNDSLLEMATLVEVGSMDDFMMSSVLSCMKLVEGASAATAYDIRGCADMLKSNQEFHRLCKVLFIKYNVFSKIPPKMQLLLLVSTTAYMCSNKNRGKDALNQYLNEPI
jgi:hypothetical protein